MYSLSYLVSSISVLVATTAQLPPHSDEGGASWNGANWESLRVHERPICQAGHQGEFSRNLDINIFYGKMSAVF